METPMRMIVYFVVAVAIISTAYVMYDSVIKQQEPYQLAEYFDAFSGYYTSEAGSEEAIDNTFDEVYTGEECSAEGGLDKCYEELANIMEGQGLLASEELMSRARRVKYCKGVVDQMIEDCITIFDEERCYDSRDKYVAECYYL